MLRVHAIKAVNPDILWGFYCVSAKRAWIQGARSEGDTGIFNNMSRSPNKLNVVDMPDCADAVETPWETLINCLYGMKCKAHGAQEPRHI